MARHFLPWILSLFVLCLACKPAAVTYNSFDEYPVYPDEDLWVNYSAEQTVFSLWSPAAEAVRLQFYDAGHSGSAVRSELLDRAAEGLWRITLTGDLQGMYYTFSVKHNGDWLAETPGIYATAVGVNGHRAMVLDFKSTDPPGWELDRRPNLTRPNQAVIYELHVRDITSHPNSGSSLPGKYLGLVELGTTGPHGIATGIDHMQELGITHVHLLPSYDHYSINELNLDSAQFNWGYDPQNYNVPEGSYSSDPFNAEVRVREFKEMVKAFHDVGIGVILDVVYNHTGRTEDANFNLEAPGYYYRFNDDGSYSDASACGNETASERAMMRKFIVESVCFWAQEYHLDGFRFDLMGIHDIETMNAVADALKKIDQNIFVYGEGWTASGSPLPEAQRALKKHTQRMPQITAFSDDMRDGLKGSVFDDQSTGFVSGAENTEESVKFGVVGSIQHPQINYQAVNYSDAPWTNNPHQAISYVSCHDNHTLFDKLTISRKDADPREILAMHKLANAVVLTAQGIPFLHAGVELMRTKNGEHNSYNLPDAINRIDWNWKTENTEVFNYYKDLIAMRKAHPAFALATGQEVRDQIRFLDTPPGTVAFEMGCEAPGESWKKAIVYYNATNTVQTFDLAGSWIMAAEGNIVQETIRRISGKMEILPISMAIAYQR